MEYSKGDLIPLRKRCSTCPAKEKKVLVLMLQSCSLTHKFLWMPAWCREPFLFLMSVTLCYVCMRIHEDSNNNLWFKEMEDKSRIIFKTIKETARNWEGIFEQESQRSFDMGNGPLWRVTMLQEFFDSDKRHYENCLIFTFHHIICDGGSIMALYSQFLEYVNDLKAGKNVEVESMKLLEPCLSLMSHKIQATFLEKTLFYFLPFVLRVRSLFFKPKKNSFLEVFPPVILQNPSVEKKTVVIPRVIKADEMSKIIKSSKQHKCTIHGTITAATHLAMAQILQSGTGNTLPDPVSFTSSFNVSLRKECQPEVNMKEFGCFISVNMMDIPTPCAGITKEVFWKFAQECNKMVQSKVATKEHHKFLKMFANADVKSLFASMINNDESNGGRYDNMFNISNRGRFSIGEDEDDWQYKFAGTYFAMAEQHAGPPLANCVVSVNGNLYWGLIYYLNITTRKQAEEFIDLSLNILREASASV
uniref:Uncharacterized protein LOC116294330 n=1 Tax=Actinia tenebrosa TaxID=6105 RepID=A0A6P8HYN9_ACTTE